MRYPRSAPALPGVPRSASTARTRFPWGSVRYRLDVVALDVGDVVSHAGGWLFDRAVAGWDIAVLVAEPSDPRPLQILGVQPLVLEDVMADRGAGRQPHALAVAAGACVRDRRTRRGLENALDDGGVEVVVWGDDWPADAQYPIEPVTHRLSYAARLFKAHALNAAGIPFASVAATESFISGIVTYPSIGQDLAAASGPH